MQAHRWVSITLVFAALGVGCLSPASPSAGEAGHPQVHQSLPERAPSARAVPASRHPEPDPLDEPQPPQARVTIWSWGIEGVGMDGRANPLPDPLTGLSDVTAVAVGLKHSLGLKLDGTVWTWSNGGSADRADRFQASASQPERVPGLTNIVAVAAGDFHSLALGADGTVWSWGLNRSGQLGDGTQGSRLEPAAVAGLGPAIAIAAGTSHSVALLSDGTVRTWGYGVYGTLGTGEYVSSPVPQPVAGLTEVTAVAASGRTTLAISHGEVWAWGYGMMGTLGPDLTGSSLPVRIEGLPEIVAIAGGWDHCLAISATGDVWAWGNNAFGQLGDGSVGGSHGEPAPVHNLVNVQAVAAGEYHSLALTADGQLWSWGRNVAGELGAGSTRARVAPEPMRVVGLDRVTAFSARGSYSLAVQAPTTRYLASPVFRS